LTAKRVKMRIDKMFSAKVIERFIALIIPSILGYTVTCAFVLRKNMVNKDSIDKINWVGDIHFQFHTPGGIMGFSIAVKEESEDKIELLVSSKIYYNLTQTDYCIIKRLIMIEELTSPSISVARDFNESNAACAKTILSTKWGMVKQASEA